MAKSGQVCFHKRLFANPVKLQRCTTEPVGPLDSINKDVGGAKLLLTTTSVYPVDCACFCPLYWRHSTTVCVLMVAVTCLRLPAHPNHTPTPLPPTHPFIHTTHDITVTVKKLLKIQQC